MQPSGENSADIALTIGNELFEAIDEARNALAGERASCPGVPKPSQRHCALLRSGLTVHDVAEAAASLPAGDRGVDRLKRPKRLGKLVAAFWAAIFRSVLKFHAR